ncbi:MAG: hypothetical protein F4018_00990 [Acidobacteria bacterium]|nr:hypothetical protein [Acidobacteriota bacterium]
MTSRGMRAPWASVDMAAETAPEGESPSSRSRRAPPKTGRIVEIGSRRSRREARAASRSATNTPSTVATSPAAIRRRITLPSTPAACAISSAE